MTGPKGNSVFWFLETLHVPRGKAILFSKYIKWFEPSLSKESYTVIAHYENKQLMTGPKGNSEVCFLENLHVPWGKTILFSKLNYWFEPYLRKESYTVKAHYENKQLIPGQKRKGEFCFLETLHDPQGKAILLFTKLNYYWFEPYLSKESYKVTAHEDKQLMPGQKRNSEFFFLQLRPFTIPEAKPRGTLRLRGTKLTVSCRANH